MISNKKFLTNQNNIKVHCHQMYVFLTIRTNLDFWTFEILSFALFWQHSLLRTWPFLTVCEVCQSVFSFVLVFSKLCIAWSCLVLAVSSIMVATLTVVCWQLLLKWHHVVLMLHHSLIHQPLSLVCFYYFFLSHESILTMLEGLLWFSHLFFSFLYSFSQGLSSLITNDKFVVSKL